MPIAPGTSAPPAGVTLASLIAAASAYTDEQLVGVRRLRPQVWAIGDSIISNGILPSKDGSRQGGACIFTPGSPLGWALLQTAGKYVFGGVGATQGFTTAQVRATHLPEVLAAAPGVCVIACGTNNTAGGNDAAAMADIEYMATELRAVGTLPVLCTIPPQGTAPVGFVTRLNARIRAYARANGLPCVDPHKILQQATTGGLGPAYNSGDGIHPNNLGARAMGDALAAVLNAIPLQPLAAQLLGGFDSSAMMQDVCYQVVAGHWAQAGSGAAVATSTGASWKGNKVTLTAGGVSHSKFLTGTLGSQPTAGQRISALAKIDAPTVPALGTWSALVVDTGGQSICGYSSMDQTLPAGSVLAFDFTATAGQINASAWTVSYSVAITDGTQLAAAETSLLNLSALGVS